MTRTSLLTLNLLLSMLSPFAAHASVAAPGAQEIYSATENDQDGAIPSRVDGPTSLRTVTPPTQPRMVETRPTAAPRSAARPPLRPTARPTAKAAPAAPAPRPTQRAIVSRPSAPTPAPIQTVMPAPAPRMAAQPIVRFQSGMPDSALSYDPVPSDQMAALGRRLELVQALIKRHGRAYDYRTHTIRDLEVTLAQLDASLKPAPAPLARPMTTPIGGNGGTSAKQSAGSVGSDSFNDLPVPTEADEINGN